MFMKFYTMTHIGHWTSITVQKSNFYVIIQDGGRPTFWKNVKH